MKKVLLGVVIGIGALFGLDYSKMSNEELIKQSGKFPANEVLEYYQELDQRSQKMTQEQRREFFLQINQEKIKTEDQMLVKDLRERKREIRKIISNTKNASQLHKKLRRIHSYGGCEMKGHGRKHNKQETCMQSQCPLNQQDSK